MRHVYNDMKADKNNMTTIAHTNLKIKPDYRIRTRLSITVILNNI